MIKNIFIFTCMNFTFIANAQSTWVPSSGSNMDWSTSSNWSPSTVPNGVGAGAVFTSPSDDLSVSLNQNITLGSISITNNTGFDFSVNSGSGGDLILDSGILASTITVSGDGDTTNKILTPVSLQSHVVVTVNNVETTSSSGALEISGPISGSGGLTKAGQGTLTLSGVDNHTYTGATVVSEGRLRVTSGSEISSTSSITVETGAQLQFIGPSGHEWNLGSAVINLGEMNQDQTPGLILSGGTTSSSFQTIHNDINLGGGISDVAIRVEMDSNYVLTGNVGGGSLIKQGEGLLQLTQTNNSYVQNLWIQSGSVNLAGNDVLNPFGYISFGQSYSSGHLSLPGNQTVGGLISVESPYSEFNQITGSNGSVLTIDTYSNEVFVFGDGTPQNSGVITGDINVVKKGVGTQILGGNNTYTGTTTILEGVLVVNGSAGTGGLIVSGPGILGGSGTIASNTTIQDGGTHSPGNSPGLQSFSDGLSYNTGAVFEWELFSNGNDLSDRGITYDGVNVIDGTLFIDSGVTASLVFNSETDDLNSSVNWGDSFWDNDQIWLVFENLNEPNLILNSIFSSNMLSPDSLGVSLQSVRANAGFAWLVDENDIYLTYSAIPEPAAIILMAITFAALGLTHNRRCKKAGKRI
ncbi:MAG: autotransporter-associated beta strand repeat-containing protein [Verrucomicrobia bacterium]|nr:autotransporter-associated beta strand repeat-containing protein [Verrucomicrobiota bacterium]